MIIKLFSVYSVLVKASQKAIVFFLQHYTKIIDNRSNTPRILNLSCLFTGCPLSSTPSPSLWQHDPWPQGTHCNKHLLRFHFTASDFLQPGLLNLRLMKDYHFFFARNSLFYMKQCSLQWFCILRKKKNLHFTISKFSILLKCRSVFRLMHTSSNVGLPYFATVCKLSRMEIIQNQIERHV